MDYQEPAGILNVIFSGSICFCFLFLDALLVPFRYCKLLGQSYFMSFSQFLTLQTRLSCQFKDLGLQKSRYSEGTRAHWHHGENDKEWEWLS